MQYIRSLYGAKADKFTAKVISFHHQHPIQQLFYRVLIVFIILELLFYSDEPVYVDTTISVIDRKFIKNVIMHDISR